MSLRTSFSAALGAGLIGSLTLAAAVIGPNFSGIDLNQTVALGAGAIPPDMGMSVGPTQIVQIINGGYEVFDKAGNSLGAVVTDKTFWTAAGISGAVTGAGLSDPRVIYDPGSGRFFISEINVSNTGNQVLLGVSNTSNPLGGWKAVNFTGNSGFADFPMLGLDKNGVYVSTNNFASSTGAFTGVSVFSLPKADLLLAAPSIARLSSFENLDANSVGFGMNPASDFGGGHGALLAISNTSFNQAVFSNISGSGAAGATLSSPTVLTGLSDGSPAGQRQPDGTRTVDGGDDRFGSGPFVVGNLLYATNTISDNGDPNLATHDIVHWMIMDLTTKAVLKQGLISDPNFDFTYSSIAANANGDFVIGFNRSGAVNDPSNNISAYAEVCHFDGTNAVCQNPLLLKQGLRGDYHLGSPVRWGDYSAIAVDPNDPNSFWTALEIPIDNSVTSGQSRWGTQITEITLNSTPEPATFGLLAAGALLLMWRRRSTPPDYDR